MTPSQKLSQRLLAHTLALTLSVALSLTLSLIAPLAISSANAEDAPPACSAPAYRQFDFWIGEWRVTLADGTLAGTNRITSLLGGCALQENWTGVTLLTGQSLNAYDSVRGVWRQNWVDSSGSSLVLEGGWNGTAMVLEGATVGEKSTTHHRISWTPIDPRQVRQIWATREGESGEWAVVFDGLYTKQ